MGYVISYEDLRDIYTQMEEVISSIRDESILNVSSLLSEFISDDRMQGKTADTIKGYLGEVHGTIMQGILDASKQLLTKVLLYQNGYYNIDSNKDTVIYESFVNYIDEVVKKFIESQGELTSNFKIYTNEISDIFFADAPDDYNIQFIGSTINIKNENLHNDIINYEILQKDGLNDVEELICTLINSIESCKKNLGGFNIPSVDLAVVKANIVKAQQFQNDNIYEIESACDNQQAILKEIEIEKQAKERKEQGVWKCVLGVVAVCAGVAAIICTGGAATPVVVTTTTKVLVTAKVVGGTLVAAKGVSDAVEGAQDVYYGSIGDIDSKSKNPIRDTIFGGDQEAYDNSGDVLKGVNGVVDTASKINANNANKTSEINNINNTSSIIN